MSEYVKKQVEEKRGTRKKYDSSKHPENYAQTITNGESSTLPNGHADESGSISNVDSTGGVANTGNAEDSQERVDISAFNLTLNPDVGCGQTPQTEEEKAEWEKDENEVRAVCTHLQQTVFSDLLSDLREGEVGFPMDGLSLSNLLHKRGINVRYLGRLAKIADQDARGHALKALAEQEMISRAFKHVVYRYLRDLPNVFTAACISHLLNCILGTRLNPSPVAEIDDQLRSLYPDSNVSYLEATPEALKSELEAQVQIRYRYVLPEVWIRDVKHVQLLRSISLKLGLQLVSKDYSFVRTMPSSDDQHGSNGIKATPTLNGHASVNGANKKKKKANIHGQAAASSSRSADGPLHTFRADDIANIVPLIKDSCPKSSLAEEAFEAGKISIMQNQKEIGQELLLESLTLHEQVYGALHPEVARVYHQLAMLYYQLDEKSWAIELAHKAVIISERTLGVDSSETILSYLNLALFEHGNQNTAAAINCVRHALDLWNIIYGTNHPDCMTTFNNAAVMLQQLHLYHDSRIWFEKSLSMSENISGRSSVNTGTLLFQLAQAQVLDGDSKGSVQRMQAAYHIFYNRLGPQDINTRESEQWLEKLTQNAVSQAKQEKEGQSKRLRNLLMRSRPANMGSTRPQAGQSPTTLRSANVEGATALDPRKMDEIVKYFAKAGDVSKSASKKKGSTKNHPRARGGPSVSSTA